MVQHVSITDPNIHEPKGIAAATNGTIYVANGAGSGTWKKITESENINFTDKSKNLFGWNDISDSTYTSGAPLAILSGVRTQLPNNGLAAQSDTSRLGAIWNNVSNKFVISDLNATYIIRVNFKLTAAAAAGTPYTAKLELETSNGPTVLSGSDKPVKGGGYVNSVSDNSLVYIGPFINGTDLKFFITPDTNINIHTIGFVIQRLYKES